MFGLITNTVANPTLTAGQSLRVNNYLVTVPNAPQNTVAGMVQAINASGIPNVIATTTPDLIFVGDGLTQTYNIGPLYTATTSYTTVVFVNTVLQTAGADYTYNASTETINFVVAPIFGATITVISGRITISVKNIAASTPSDRLTVLPGLSGTVFTDLGFETYPSVQTIRSPNPTDYAQFGASVHIDSNSTNLVVGAPNGTAVEPDVFDNGLT